MTFVVWVLMRSLRIREKITKNEVIYQHNCIYLSCQLPYSAMVPIEC